MPDVHRKRVDCTECSYSRIVHAEDDSDPVDVLIDHGRETGHKLTVTDLEDERDQLSP